VDGNRYDNTYCWVVRFREGALIELVEYMDTELVRAALGPAERSGGSRDPVTPR